MGRAANRVSMPIRVTDQGTGAAWRVAPLKMDDEKPAGGRAGSGGAGSGGIGLVARIFLKAHP